MSAYLGLGSSANTQKIIKYSGIQISTSQLDIPVTLFWGQRRISPNLIWYNNFQAKAVSAKGKGGGGKGGGNYDYSAAVILALGEGEIDSIVNVWSGGSTTNVTTLSKLGFSFIAGTPIQVPWSFVVTKYPLQARSYLNTSYLTNPKLDLGSSPTVPDNAFECVRSNGFTNVLTSPGWKNPTTGVVTNGIDCSMADIIPDFLTFPRYGMGFSMSDMGDMSQFTDYQTAQSLYFSPLLNNQEKGTSVIDRWAQLSNSWIYCDGLKFQFVPLGDATITANGATYTPDLASAYDFGVSDYTDKENPVRQNRVDPADCYNRAVLEISDRTQGYVSNPIEYKDQTLIDEYGKRDASSTTADEICNPAVGVIVAQLVGKRAAYIRKTFSFKVSHRFIRILPGCVVTLTEPNLKLNKFRVRVKEIEEDDNNDLTFTAEECPQGIGTFNPPTATATAGDVTVPNQNVDPGSVNTPCIVEPNSAFTGGTPKVLLAASGGVNWGGADVYISFDLGTDYTKIGEITTPAAQGLLTAILASHADPDTVNTLSVNLAESLTTPAPVTNADADALRTLSLVVAQPSAGVVSTNGELLAFGNTSTTGTYTADLTYLRRGQYGTAPASHAIGDQFTLIDLTGLAGTTLEYPLPAQYVGQQIYVKFASKNVFGGPAQDLSLCTEYKYTPTGAGYGGGTGGTPTTPTGLTVSAGSGQNIISWNANPATDNVKSYTLYIGSGTSTPIGSCLAIPLGSITTFTQSGVTSGGAFTYYLKANNAIGPSAAEGPVNATAGAFAFPSVADGDLFANITGSTNPPSGNTFSAFLDHVLGNTQGSILYRDTSVWALLGPGTSGYVLSTNGAGANPSWIVGGGGGGGYPAGHPPTVVQVAYSTSAVSATFSVAPTAGNSLVAFTFNSANNAVAAGWTKRLENSSGTDWGNVCDKTAGASEPTTQQAMSTSTSSGGVVIYELAEFGGGTPSFVFGQTQSEQFDTSIIPVQFANVKDFIGISACGLVGTSITYTLVFNLGTQDVLDNTGNRRMLAAHSDLGALPICGVMGLLSGTGSTKCCAVLYM